ncbi:hypothetical protein BSKO_05666 [Bryopsis sp. KO-2023]|nr:hypothetical protein BSKO_05666 [Bryopsis sp. KO-2023]
MAPLVSRSLEGCSPHATTAISRKPSIAAKAVRRERNGGCVGYLRAAQRLANARGRESRKDAPLFVDLFAELLCDVRKDDTEKSPSTIEAQDVIATQYLDECLMQAVSLTNESRGDYRQVVLLGPGLDTRPFRLPWPAGTVIYSVAPAELNKLAIDKIGQETMRASLPKGCIHIPVDVDFTNQDGGGLMDGFAKTPFQGDKPSVWDLQGMSDVGLSQSDWANLFAEIGCLASFQSLISGELPESATFQLLAESGFLGAIVEYGDPEANYNRWPFPAGSKDSQSLGVLFSAQHQRLSLKEMETYEAHVTAAEETDEDFFGNFS